jgi:hypothetical protein
MQLDNIQWDNVAWLWAGVIVTLVFFWYQSWNEKKKASHKKLLYTGKYEATISRTIGDVAQSGIGYIQFQLRGENDVSAFISCSEKLFTNVVFSTTQATQCIDTYDTRGFVLETISKDSFCFSLFVFLEEEKHMQLEKWSVKIGSKID